MPFLCPEVVLDHKIYPLNILASSFFNVLCVLSFLQRVFSIVKFGGISAPSFSSSSSSSSLSSNPSFERDLHSQTLDILRHRNILLPDFRPRSIVGELIEFELFD